MKRQPVSQRSPETNGSRIRLRQRATRLTSVSWLPSLAARSAMLLFRAWCWATAALVAPPATPTRLRPTPARQRTGSTSGRGRNLAKSSTIITRSLVMSANIRHLLQSWSRLVPTRAAKMILPTIPAPSLRIQVRVAARGVAAASPTPTPSSTAAVARLPVTEEANAWTVSHTWYSR